MVEFIPDKVCQTQNEFYSSAYNRTGLLQYYAKKYGDLRTAIYYGNDKWSKHHSVIYCQETQDWNHLLRAGHRQILPNEIVLDFDPEGVTDLEQWQLETIDRMKYILERHVISAKVYSTGSRGFHIHFFINPFDEKGILDEKKTEEIKKTYVNMFKTDKHKIYAKSLIAIEFAPHWKSKKQKQLIYDTTGVMLNDLF
jgi:hypothetical protein